MPYSKALQLQKLSGNITGFTAGSSEAFKYTYPRNRDISVDESGNSFL